MFTKLLDYKIFTNKLEEISLEKKTENDFVSKFSEKIMYLNNNKHIIKKKSNLSLQEFNINYTLDIFKDKIFKI